MNDANLVCSVGVTAYNEEENIGHLLEALIDQHLHNVEIGEIFSARFRKRKVSAVLVLDLQALPSRQELVAVEGEIRGRVIENIMPAFLRFEQDRERRITANIDAIDRIHLHCDAKIHVKRLEASGGA